LVIFFMMSSRIRSLPASGAIVMVRWPDSMTVRNSGSRSVEMMRLGLKTLNPRSKRPAAMASMSGWSSSAVATRPTLCVVGRQRSAAVSTSSTA